jgi:hypothetical protein
MSYDPNRYLMEQNIVSERIARDIATRAAFDIALQNTLITNDIAERGREAAELGAKMIAEDLARRVRTEPDYTRIPEEPQQRMAEQQQLQRGQLEKERATEDARLSDLNAAFNPNYQESPFSPSGIINRPQEEHERCERLLQGQQFVLSLVGEQPSAARTEERGRELQAEQESRRRQKEEPFPRRGQRACRCQCA